MNQDKQKAMVLIGIATVILVAANLGIWQAAQVGVIAPAGNQLLWGGFVALNVVSVLWSVSVLGLHPLPMAFSYIAGGVLAFKGVQGVGGIGMAEATAAGATYGAFGALAIGNATVKIRMAFFNRRQVPFIFMLAGLLVLNAVLSSGIAGAGGRAILGAFVLPFLLAGVAIGLFSSVLARAGLGRKKDGAAAAVQAKPPGVAQRAVGQEDDPGTLMIQLPAHVLKEEEENVPSESTRPAVAQPAQPVLPVAATAAEEHFFPLEIDKHDGFVHLPEDFGLSAMMDEFGIGDAMEPEPLLYAPEEIEDNPVETMKEPVAAVSMDVDDILEKLAVRTQAPEPTPESNKESKSTDWLSSHMDLLGKLK